MTGAHENQPAPANGEPAIQVHLKLTETPTSQPTNHHLAVHIQHHHPHGQDTTVTVHANDVADNPTELAELLEELAQYLHAMNPPETTEPNQDGANQ